MVSFPLYGQNEWKKTNGPFSENISDYLPVQNGKIIFFTWFDSTYIMDETGKNLSKISFDTSVFLSYGIEEPFLNNKDSNILLTDGFTLFILNDKEFRWEKLNLNLDSAEKASRKQFFQIRDTVFLSIMSKGLYRLSEDFSSWIKVYSYLPNIPIDFFKIVCSKNDIYFANNEKGVYKSRDYGKSWVKIKSINNSMTNWLISAPSATIYIRNFSTYYRYDETQDSLIHVFSFQPDPDYYNSESLCFGTNDIFLSSSYQIKKSSDTGKTFNEVFQDSLCKYCIWNIKINNNKIYFLQNYRLFSSNDNAQSWQSIEPGCNKSPIEKILPISKDTVVVINQRALFATFDRGMNYKLAIPQCTSATSKLIMRNGFIFGKMNDIFFYSAISDLNWTVKKMYISDFDVDSKNNIYYSYPGLFKSSDFLANSIENNGNLPVYGTSKKPSVTAICIIRDKEIITGIGSNNYQVQGIYKSYDDGLTWASKINNTREVKGFLRDNNLIIGIPDYYYSDTIKKVLYISKDFGETWTINETPFEQGDYKYFLSPNRTLFASKVGYKELGVFTSNDLGKTFIPFPIDLDSKNITDIAFGPDSTIWFGTDSGSVYYSEKPEFSSVRESQIETGINISPNPATDFIEISKPPEGSSNTVRIFNVFGEIVKNPTQTLPEGEDLRIDVSGLPSGMYFVRVGEKVGKFVKL